MGENQSDGLLDARMWYIQNTNLQFVGMTHLLPNEGHALDIMMMGTSTLRVPAGSDYSYYYYMKYMPR